MSEASNEPAPSRTRKGCTSRLLFAAMVLVIASFSTWLRSDDFNQRATSFVEGTVSSATGETLEIQRIAVALWPPALTVHGAEIRHAATGDTILSIEHARVPLVLRNGGPGVGRLSLIRPRLHIHLEEDGKLREFRNVTPPNTPPKPLVELPFHSLEVLEASFMLDFPGGSIEIARLDAVPVDGPRTDIAATLQVQIGEFDEEIRVEIPEVALGPREISAPYLELSHDGVRIRGSGAWPLGGSMHAEFTAHIENQRLPLPPPRSLGGQLDLQVNVDGTLDALVATGTMQGRSLSATVPRIAQGTVTYNLQDLDASFTADAHSIDVDMLQLTWGEGTVNASGVVTVPDFTLHDGHVVGEALSLADILVQFGAAPTPWVDFVGDAEVVVEGSLRPLHLQGPFDLAIMNLDVRDGPVADGTNTRVLDLPHAWASGQLLIEKDHITLDADQLRGPRSQGSTVVDIGFGPVGPLDVRFDLGHAVLRDFGPLGSANLGGEGHVQGRIAGPFKALSFEGSADVTDFRCVGVPWADRLTATLSSPALKTLEFHGAAASVGHTRYGGDFAIDFRSPLSLSTELVITTGRIEDLTGLFVDLPGLEGDIDGAIALEGPMYHLEGDAFARLVDVTLAGEKFPTGEARAIMSDGIFELEEMTLSRAEGTENATVQGTIGRGWAVDMDIDASGMALEHLDAVSRANLPLSGQWSLQSSVGGTLATPHPNGHLSLESVRWGDAFVDDSFVEFTTTEGVFAFTGTLVGSTVDMAGTVGLWTDESYAIDAAFESFPIDALFPVGADGQPVDGTLTGSTNVHGRYGNDSVPINIVAEVQDVWARWGRHDLRNTTPWTYQQDGNTWLLQNFGLSGGATRLQADFTAAPDLDISGSGVVDLDLLRAVVPGLEVSEGLATVDFSADGRMGEVRAVVDADIDGSLMRHNSVPASLEDLTGSVRLTAERFDIAELQARIGGGTFSAKGTITANRWRPSRYDIVATADDAQVQWVSWLPPAIGNGTFRFDGPTDQLLLSGDVDIREMIFSDRIDWQDGLFAADALVVDSTEVGTSALFDFDVDIRADRSISLDNNVAEGIASADLTVTGDTVRPGLTGRAWIDEGIAFVYDREFLVERGRLDFMNPWSWDPMLDFDLATEIESGDQHYSINYLVYDPYSAWKTRTRSEPALPQADVNALLLFGVTTQELNETSAAQAFAGSLADLFLTDVFIGTQAGEVAQELAYFDRVDVVTGVNARGEYSPDPRLLFQKRYEELGNAEMTGEINLGAIEDQYYRLGWRLSDSWTFWAWYATMQRERVLPIGGAYGVDISARWDSR